MVAPVDAVRTGRKALLASAPDAADALLDLVALPAADLSDPRVRAFAEQFAVDVSGIDEALRAAYLEATGNSAFDVVQLIWSDDVPPRVLAALDAVFAPSTWEIEPAAVSASGSWPMVERLLRSVARLSTLDPVLTEVVRLRGARQHDCRLCRSRRSAAALDAGAGEETFDQIDRWPDSDLPDSTKAALALTDAMIWTPRAIPEQAVAAVRRHLSAAQSVEVILDVARNAANKIAVALGADAPTVTDGVELFATDADGNLTVV